MRSSRYTSVAVAILLAAAAFSAHVNQADAQALFSENFDDLELAENAMVNENVTIENGIARFDDPETARATFVVVQDFTAPVMTFSFDIVEPVVDLGNAMELLLRAGVGTDNNTLQSGEQIVEAIVFRGGNRGDYVNNGNETIFLVANNNADPITFESPIDGTDVMLNGFQYIPYVRNNETEMFGEIKGISDFNPANQASFGTFQSFGIGSSQTADIGTFAIDNVLVMSGVSFEQDVGPPPVPGDVNGDGFVMIDDFDIIRDNFRMTVTSRAQGDLVSNGMVDLFDFKEWKTEFLAGGGSLAGVDLGFIANVPEPAAWSLAMLGALAIVARRKFWRC